MSAARFVYIGDQGRVFSSVDEPTAEDLDFAAVGMLTIVSLRELRYYGREQQWLPIRSGRLTSREDDRNSLPFHTEE